MIAQLFQYSLFILGFIGISIYILIRESPKDYFIAYILLSIAGMIVLYLLYILACWCMYGKADAKAEAEARPKANENPLVIAELSVTERGQRDEDPV
jgi:hypothetical protein